MIKQVSGLLLLVALSSCGLTGNKKEPERAYKPLPDPTGGRISFSFEACRQSLSDSVILIDALLHNNDTSTAYFLTTTCKGEQYQLCYETQSFRLAPGAICNAVWPLIREIPPQCDYRFIASIRSQAIPIRIRLGFAWCETDKATYLNGEKTMETLKLLERSDTLWAEEQNVRPPCVPGVTH